jgi:hypothetical protein
MLSSFRSRVAITRLARDQVGDADGIVLLAEAVDAAHALLQPRGIPGDVVVDHPPAELQVDALARRVGGDQEARPAFFEQPAEARHLALALLEIHAAVDARDLLGVAQALQSAHQELQGVAVLSEDDQLLVGIPGVAQHLAQLEELRLIPRLVDAPCQRHQPSHALALDHQLGQRTCRDQAQRLLLGQLVLLAAVHGALFVGRLVLEEVSERRGLLLAPAQLRLAEPAALDVRDQPVEALQPPLEGAQQRVGRAGQPPLEDAHSQPHRRAVQNACLVVVLLEVVRGRVVQLLLAGGEVVAQRVALALGIDGAAVVVDHLFLGAPHEVPLARLGRVGVEGVHRRERLRLQQAPERVVGEVLAHMRRRGEQQQVLRAPRQLPARILAWHAGQRLGQAVAVGLA